MKQRERINRIREEKEWTKKMALARDKRPGTEFDEFIRKMQNLAWPEKLVFREGKLVPFDPKKDGPPLSDIQEMVNAISNGDSGWFRRFAKALEVYHSHQSSPDHLRVALLRLCPNPNEGISIDNLIYSLWKLGIVTESQREDASVERRVRRLCLELDIKIIGEKGRPKKGTRILRKTGR